jgi:hypothetical protein
MDMDMRGMWRGFAPEVFTRVRVVVDRVPAYTYIVCFQIGIKLPCRSDWRIGALLGMGITEKRTYISNFYSYTIDSVPRSVHKTHKTVMQSHGFVSAVSNYSILDAREFWSGVRSSLSCTKM